ncbi:MAG TPA: aldo/keto reductase [Candidatus Eremiobacteraceae bacterium]|nr:aldo/keto reductase [Candidatus Eremiobacteraceae bacterium]
MKYRNVGKSGLVVSALGIGCNAFGGRIDLEATRLVVDKALELGVTLFDTADIYSDRGGSESALGQILRGKRDDLVIATKFGGPMDDAGMKRGASRRHIMAAVEASLRRLQTDWIDLYQLHFPDPSTPMEETLRALDDLVRQGKVRYIGNSNLAGWQIADADHLARALNSNAFISCQNEYSLLVRDVETEVIPAAKAYGLGMLPYFPLAGGLLTGKYERDIPAPAGTRFVTATQLAQRYQTPANWTAVEKLKAFGASRGWPLIDLAVSWLLARKPVCSVIAGATKPEQVVQNAAALDRELTEADLAEIDTIVQPERP